MYQMRYITSYDLEKIGKRIRTERKAAGYSQEALCGAINEKGIAIDRQKLGEMENGKTAKFDFDILAALCDLFDCEIGYLLCEAGYENKTRAKTDIGTITGLSPQSIEKLTAVYYAAGAPNPYNETLDAIMQAPQYWDLLDCVLKCVETAQEARKAQSQYIKAKNGYEIGQSGVKLPKRYISDTYGQKMALDKAELQYTASVYNATVVLSNMIDGIALHSKKDATSF